MAKYLDLTAHHEVALDEILGKKATSPKEKTDETKNPPEIEVKRK